MKFKTAWLVVLIIMLSFLSACVARLPREGCLKYHSPQQAFLTGDYDCAQKLNAPKMAETLQKDPQHKDFALWYLKEGLYYYEGGDAYKCLQDFKTARSVMERIKEEDMLETAAIFWSEDVKTYKGDPYEKVLVNFMLGMAYYRDKEYENALSAFRRSISADQLTHNDDDKLRDDNALSHYLAGKCYLYLKEPESAQQHFRKAAAIAPNNPYVRPEEIAGKNLIVVLETGLGPLKMRTGVQGSLTTFATPYPTPALKENSGFFGRDKKVTPAMRPEGVEPPRYALINEESRADVYINGELKGSSAEALDIYQQAESHGWGDKDTVQTVKGVAKEVISHIPYVGIVALLIQAQADIRTWNLVPAKYQLFTASLPPGLYNLTFKFYDAKGQELKHYEQTWYYIPVEEKQETFLLLRSRDFLHAWYADAPRSGGGK